MPALQNNVKDGKRLHPTPTRLYRVPGTSSAASALKRNKDIEAAYHGCGMSYKDNVRNTTRVETYPKFGNSGTTGVRDSASRQQEEQERRRNDPDHRDGVSAARLVPAMLLMPRWEPGASCHTANCHTATCVLLLQQSGGRRPAHLFDMEVTPRSHTSHGGPWASLATGLGAVTRGCRREAARISLTSGSAELPAAPPSNAPQPFPHPPPPCPPAPFRAHQLPSPSLPPSLPGD